MQTLLPLSELIARAFSQYAPRFDAAKPTAAAAAKEVEASPQQDEAQISLSAFQSFHFEMFWEKVMQSSRQADFLQGDEARSLSEDLYQKVSASFSFDLSVLSVLADRTGRAAAIDEDVYKNFIDAASNLSSLNAESLQAFLASVDELFNAAEQSLGLASDGLDDVAESMKDSIKGFFSEITAAAQQMKVADKDAATDFGKKLQDLLQPPEQANEGLKGVRRQLQDAGVPDSQQAALMKMAQLMYRLSRAEDPERQQSLMKRLERLANKVIDNLQQVDPAAASPKDEPQPAVPATLQLQQYTQSMERFSVTFEQSQLNLAA